jgi:hypothetical protein
MPRPRFSRERDPVLIKQEAELAHLLSLRREKYLVLAKNLTLDRQAHFLGKQMISVSNETVRLAHYDVIQRCVEFSLVCRRLSTYFISLLVVELT